MIDAASGTREIILQLSAGHRLTPGSSVTVRLGSEPRHVITIPRTAVDDEGYALVWSNERTTLRALTLGSEVDGDRVEVRQRPRTGREGHPEPAVSRGAKLRPDLVLVEQTYRGEQSFIVKDPATRKYFRFRPVEIMVMQALDGEHTAAEAAAVLAEEGIRVSPAGIEAFAVKLGGMGLCERTLGERSVLQMERLRAERKRRLSKSVFQGDLLRIRWSVGDPDKLFDRWLPRLRFFFTRTFLVISVALFAVYLSSAAASNGESSPRHWPISTPSTSAWVPWRFCG